MIRLQIVERPGSDLFAKLKEAMGTGTFKTLIPMKRGRKIVHKTYPGWMNWSHQGGVILCEILSPKKPGLEWQLFSAFVGRLADREAASIHSIDIQFPDAVPEYAGRPRKKRRR
jgi:hypothetical protein